MIEYLLFDVDNTLYPRTSGLLQQVDARINQFMMDEVGIAFATVDEKRKAYRDRYGTTLKGLMIDYGIDQEHYIAYVHDVPIEKLIPQNPRLDDTLSRLSQDRVVFTNGPIEYSSRILHALGITHHFSHFFDLRFLEFMGKPNRSAYKKVVKALATSPERCALIEDSLWNLVPAKEMEMKTVLVDGQAPDWVDAHIRDICEINEVDFL